jgi:hypothetical protein
MQMQLRLAKRRPICVQKQIKWQNGKRTELSALKLVWFQCVRENAGSG